MQKMTCQQCQASLNWDGVSEIVRCEYCGTQYRMHPRNGGGQGVTVGEGVVSPIRTSQGRYAGHALVKCFVPKGWTVRTNAPEQQANLLCPLTVQVEITSPHGDAVITFSGTQAYQHLDNIPQNAMQQGQLIHPDRMLALCYRDASTLCDMVLQGNPSLRECKLRTVSDQPDAWPRQLMEREVQQYAQAGTLNPGGTWARKQASVLDSENTPWVKQVEALVLHAYLPVSPQEQQLYQMVQQTQARTFGLRNILQQVQPPQPKLRWTIQYMLEVSAREEHLREALDVALKMRDSMEVLPVMEREIGRLREQLMLQAQQESAAVNDAMAQMNRDQMASWDRRQQILRDASDYGSNVMHQMWDSNAATHDRVNNLWSETIREVNTYHTAAPGFGVPEVVEASTQWDHVYQNTQHPDWFAASTGEAPLEFGVDFEELKPTDGNY